MKLGFIDVFAHAELPSKPIILSENGTQISSGLSPPLRIDSALKVTCKTVGGKVKR